MPLYTCYSKLIAYGTVGARALGTAETCCDKCCGCTCCQKSTYGHRIKFTVSGLTPGPCADCASRNGEYLSEAGEFDAVDCYKVIGNSTLFPSLVYANGDAFCRVAFGNFGAAVTCDVGDSRYSFGGFFVYVFWNMTKKLRGVLIYEQSWMDNGYMNYRTLLGLHYESATEPYDCTDFDTGEFIITGDKYGCSGTVTVRVQSAD